MRLTFAFARSKPRAMTSRIGLAAPLARNALTIFALLFAVPLAAQSPARPPMTAQDLVTLPRLGGAAAAPDGSSMVFPVTETDPASY